MMLFQTIATVALFAAAAVSAPVREVQGIEARAATYSGKGTWYDVGLGACGKRNNNNQMVLAMNKSQYNKKLCNKWITVKSNGKSKSAYIVDECPGCKKGSLDLSPKLFKSFASLDKGVIKVSYQLPKVKRSVIEGRNVTTVETADDDFDYDSFPAEHAATIDDFDFDEDDTPEDSAASEEDA